MPPLRAAIVLSSVLFYAMHLIDKYTPFEVFRWPWLVFCQCWALEWKAPACGPVVAVAEFFAVMRTIRVLGDAVEDAEDRTASEKVGNDARARADAVLLIKAEAQTQAERDMSAYLFHEFRADLQGIGSAVLRWSAGEPVAPHEAAAARASILHCKELVGNVMDVAKLDSGKLVLAREDFDVRAVCEEVHLAMSAAFPDMDGAVERRVVALSGIYAKGSPRHLKQVLRNLFSNACKFTVRGSVTLEASLVRETSDTVDVRFSVRDTGPGIAKADVAGVFQKYTSEERADADVKGTGKGLPLSQGFVKLMGGTIEVTSPWSADGAPGAAFHFTVPFPKGVSPAVAAAAREAEADADAASLPKNWSVLVADDNRVNRGAVSSFFSFFFSSVVASPVRPPLPQGVRARRDPIQQRTASLQHPRRRLRRHLVVVSVARVVVVDVQNAAPDFEAVLPFARVGHQRGTAL